jgi:Pectate lyase superfamily protein
MRLNLSTAMALFPILLAHAQAATVSVKSFGAAGNGTTDDTAAINAAINASAAGDTIFFPAGTYYVLFSQVDQHAIGLAPDRVYSGPASGAPAVLHGNGGYSLATFYGSDLSVQNLTFDGGGLYLGGPVSNVSIEYNVFQNIDFGSDAKHLFVNWTSTNAVHIDTSAAYSNISHNTFRHLSAVILGQYADWGTGATGIFGYGLSNTMITYNTFDTFNEGIHIFYDSLDGKNVHINHNTFTGGHRMAIEQQKENAGGLEIAYNTISHPLNGWALTFGISAAADSKSGTGIMVHDNVVVADRPVAADCRGSGCYLPYGIEAMGTGTQIYSNVIAGYWSHGVSIQYARDLIVRDNVICGPVMAKSQSFIDYETVPQPGTKILNNTLAGVCPAGLLKSGFSPQAVPRAQAPLF